MALGLPQGLASPSLARLGHAQAGKVLGMALGLSQGLRFCERFGIWGRWCIFARRLEYGSAFMCSENKEIM